MARKEQNLVLEWTHVRDEYIRLVREGGKWNGVNEIHDMAYKCQSWHRNPMAGKNDRWEGGCAADTLSYIDNGYHAPEFEHSADYIEKGVKRRATWNDEDGEPDSGRLLGGYDQFYLTSAERPHRPGLRLQVEFSFAWTVSSKTIEQYGAWIAGLIGSLESSGYDLTVDMWIYLDDLYRGQSNTRTSVLIRVKRENEVSDFTGWSALFAPTGYRHLGFLSKCLAGDKIGKVADSCLGMTIGGRGWGIDYDRENGTVKIRCNQRADSSEKFPRNKLNELAAKEGLIPKQAKVEEPEEEEYDDSYYDDDCDYEDYDQ